MKIGIDISQVVYGTGVSTYTDRLVRNLLAIDKESEYVLFGGSLRQMDKLKEFANSLKGNFTSKLFKLPPSLMDIIWNRFNVLPVDKLIGEVDVFHSSDWTQPPSKAFKVTVVHDLAPLKFPKLSHLKVVSVHKRRARRLKNADRIIVPSQATADDVAVLGIDSKKIRVVPEGPAYKPTKKNKVEEIKKKYKIFGKYLLAVGVHPRKNTERIIEAFELARPGEGLRLVIVGEPFMEVDEKRGVHLLGHVGEEDLSALYTGAEALVYPSLHEGFGIPILDAMNCGTPVVTSNVSSMPEVAGNAAVLVDPYDVNSITEGIREALSKKKTLVAKGKARVKQFSWEKAARRTLEVYKEATS